MDESGVDDRPGGRLTDHIGLGVLSARFGRDLIEEVVNRTEVREKRRRLLPAHVMIRYVIAMGLFFEESYEEVMRQLVGSLKKLGSWVDDWQVPTGSAICQVRKRLGPRRSRSCSTGRRCRWPTRAPRGHGCMAGPTPADGHRRH